MSDPTYAERQDPEVVARMARQAAKHQATCLPGLSDDRLRVVRARLLTDGEDPVTLARLDVVDAEIEKRRGCQR
jgi:hypothetical protein